MIMATKQKSISILLNIYFSSFSLYGHWLIWCQNCSPNAGPFVNICHSSGYDCLQSGKSITVNCVSVPLNTDQSIVQNCWKFTLCTYPEVLVKCVFQDIRHLPIRPPLTHRPQYGASLSNRSVFLLMISFLSFVLIFRPGVFSSW